MTPDLLRRLRFGTATLLLAYAGTACAPSAPARPVTFHEGALEGAEATTITLAADACRRQAYDSRVWETAEQVRVALSAVPPAGDAEPSCSDLVVVRLARPIGHRALVDASTGQQVPLVRSARFPGIVGPVVTGGRTSRSAG